MFWFLLSSLCDKNGMMVCQHKPPQYINTMLNLDNVWPFSASLTMILRCSSCWTTRQSVLRAWIHWRILLWRTTKKKYFSAAISAKPIGPSIFIFSFVVISSDSMKMLMGMIRKLSADQHNVNEIVVRILSILVVFGYTRGQIPRSRNIHRLHINA